MFNSTINFNWTTYSSNCL